MHRINNSYESGATTSNSSSSDGGASSLIVEQDFYSLQQLTKLFYPSLHEQTKRLSKESTLMKTLPSMLTSSQETEFSGFSSSAFVEKNCDQNGRCATSIPIHSKAIDASECSVGGSFPPSSEEYSDQDVRCQKDMEEAGCKKYLDNEALCDVSQFTVEPTSSTEHMNATPKSNDKTLVAETSKELPTLLINENSSNAVDNPICSISYVPEIELMNDLSFNGKLKAEMKKDDKSTVEGDQSTSGPLRTKSELDASSGRSALEMHLQLETSREHINEKSPNMFTDDEEDGDENANEYVTLLNESIASTSFEEKENPLDTSMEKAERKINTRIQRLLSGILPPPSVTIVEHDISTLLSLYKTNLARMDESTSIDTEKSGDTENCDSNTKIGPLKELEGVLWPQIERINAFGLHYNRTKYTENIEMLYRKLVERNVGQETGSSYTYNAAASVKRKPTRRMIASPKNRLSHLARRRAIFSKATLQSQSQLSNMPKLGKKPFIIDVSKPSRKERVMTPKRRLIANRRTPGEEIPGNRYKGRKTPSSLKKSGKKLAHLLPKAGTATRETSKRALFLSPTQEEEKVSVPSTSTELSRRIEKSKRALFSPPRRFERSISNLSNLSCSLSSFNSLSGSNQKTNQFEAHNPFNRTNGDVSSAMKRKRENDDDDENTEPHNAKQPRYHGNVPSKRSSSDQLGVSLLVKAASENSMYPNHQLSASHKQKLLWAVSTALKKKSIATTHTKFNHYASILAKVVKRLYLESLPSKVESTSGTMLRLADRLVFFVLQDKSVDDIYLEEKTRVEATKITKRVSGYVNRDEYMMRQETSAKLNSSNQLNSSDQFSNENNSDAKILTNSSSKNNVGTIALRENHDSKSAQKQVNVGFSGRNQKNLSPYNDKSRSASNLNKQIKLVTSATNSLHSNIMKVKRQISFDN